MNEPSDGTFVLDRLGFQNWSFRTFLRIKPPLFQGTNISENSFNDNLLHFHVLDELEDEAPHAKRRGNKRLELEIPLTADPGLVHNHTSGYVPFDFNEVFGPESGQEAVFDEVAPMITDSFKGINCTILAYGQTGTGKTYSISGGDSYAERGLIPRGIKLAFDEMKRRTGQEIDSSAPSVVPTIRLYVSFTEIYGEAVYDLLDPDKRYHALEDWPKAQVLETEDGLVIRNINVFQVLTLEDALNLFFMGTTNRLTSSTTMNKASSRSHAIFTLVVEVQSTEDGNHVTRCGKVNFVDLAGSERIYKEANSKEIIREGKSINLSLHFLEQVIISLRSAHHQQLLQAGHTSTNLSHQELKQDKPLHPVHIPYRNCVLTSILRDSLGGNCRSCFLFTISTDIRQFEETVSTCRFAQRVGEVKVLIKENLEVDIYDQLKAIKKYAGQLEHRLREVERARDELQHDLEICRSKIVASDEFMRLDRKLDSAEVTSIKSIVASALSHTASLHNESTADNGAIVSGPPDGKTGTRVASGDNSNEIVSTDGAGNSVYCCFEIDTPRLSAHSFGEGNGLIEKILSLNRSALVDLSFELCKALAIVNGERKQAIELHSQTSSTAAAFVASRFAGKSRRQSFNKAHRSASAINVSPPSLQSGTVVNVPALTPPTPPVRTTDPSTAGNSTNGGAISTPPLGEVRSYQLVTGVRDESARSLQQDVDAEVSQNLPYEQSVAHDALPEIRMSADGTVAGDNYGGDTFGLNSTEEITQRNEDAFIDMLVFGDQFIKHGKLGYTRSLRHVSVSTDLKFLCWSHINNLKTTKKLLLTDIDRVEIGHGYRKLKNREGCLLSVIGSDTTLDLECFCFDTFQENRVFAENWAMGLTYCIARAKGEITGVVNANNNPS